MSDGSHLGAPAFMPVVPSSSSHLLLRPFTVPEIWVASSLGADKVMVIVRSWVLMEKEEIGQGDDRSW